MKRCQITRPIGLNTPCAEIEAACARARMYSQCGLRPSHLIIPLDSGSGRTTLMEYMADKYKQSGVMSFASGPDDYIEITFDGSLQQLKRAFADVDAAAVYSNEYSNIVGMDISGLAAHLGETQMEEFIKNCKRVCGHACAVFFVHAVPTKNEERLLEKLCQSVDNVKRLAVEPYTKEEICALTVKAVADHGIEIRHEETFRAALAEAVSEFGMTGVRDALAAAEALIQLADFSGFNPAVDEECLKAMTTDWRRSAERMEVK